MAFRDTARGLLGGLQRFSQGANGLLFPGMNAAGVDPEVVRRAQAQAMMQTGFGLLGGQDFGKAYGAGQASGWEPIEQGRREATMRAAAADRQSAADFREWQKGQAEADNERQQKLDAENTRRYNRDRIGRRFDNETEQKRWEADHALRVQAAARAGRVESPAEVREYEYFKSLSPDDQARYLALQGRGGKSGSGIKVGPNGELMVDQGTDLNPRQQSGLNVKRDSLLNYAATLTGTTRAEVDRLYKEGGPAAVSKLVMEKGGRKLQGAPARIVGALPFGDTVVDAFNSDLIAPRTAGGSGIAAFQNPTGPITTPDFQAGEKQMPQAVYPLQTQAQIIEQGLAQADELLGGTSTGGGMSLQEEALKELERRRKR